MSVTKIVKNIQTSISGDELGTLIIICDLLAVEIPNDNPEPDFWEAGTRESRSIKTIHLVELHLFDSIGVDITSKIKISPVSENAVKGKLIKKFADKDLCEIGPVEQVEEKLSAADVFTAKRREGILR